MYPFPNSIKYGFFNYLSAMLLCDWWEEQKQVDLMCKAIT